MIKTKDNFTEDILKELIRKELIKSESEIINNFQKEISDLKTELKKIKNSKITEIRRLNMILFNTKRQKDKIMETFTTCPICFRTFGNYKSFTNHIRSYRNRIEKLERVEEFIKDL